MLRFERVTVEFEVKASIDGHTVNVGRVVFTRRQGMGRILGAWDGRFNLTATLNKRDADRVRQEVDQRMRGGPDNFG